MSKQITINSFDDLINFIETSNATNKDIEQLIATTLKVWILSDEADDKTKLIKDLKDYWSKYKNKPERPIFLFSID